MTSSEDYVAWRTQVAEELQRQHGIDLGVIPEAVWTRFFIRGLTPEQAANVPEIYNYVTREPGERLRK